MRIISVSTLKNDKVWIFVKLSSNCQFKSNLSEVSNTTNRKNMLMHQRHTNQVSDMLSYTQLSPCLSKSGIPFGPQEVRRLILLYQCTVNDQKKSWKNSFN